MRTVPYSGLAAIAGLALLASVNSASSAQSSSPCELLSESLVREFFTVPADTTIEQDDGSDARHPTCGYRWRVMSEAEEQAAQERNSQKMMENLQAGRSPNEGIDHNIPSHAKTRLTAVEFDSAEKAQSALESARSYLISRAETTGREPTPWDSIEGVGDKAYYHGKQLSFTSGRLLMHLDVSPVDQAVALATVIIQ